MGGGEGGGLLFYSIVALGGVPRTETDPGSEVVKTVSDKALSNVTCLLSFPSHTRGILEPCNRH